MISAGEEEKVFLQFTMGGVEDTLGVGMNFCGILELLPGVRFSGVSEKDGFCSESEPNYSNSLWG